MKAKVLRKLAHKHLLPFFSGAELIKSTKSTNRENRVALIDPCTLAFKVNQPDTRRLQLRRSQPYLQAGANRVTEKDVVEAFVDVIRDIESGLKKPYRADLLATLQRRVVCKAIDSQDFENVLLKTLDQLSIWASRLYEGHPITAAIGFVPGDETESVSLVQIWKHDFSTVLTNGHDTLLKANHAGQVLGHESLSMPNALPSFAPYRLASLALWATNGKLVVVLNRTGEILLLRDQQLLFARRSGAWHFLTPEAVVTQMGRPSDPEIRTAVLETSLDVSFARTGGCIGVVISEHHNKWKRTVVHDDDHVQTDDSVKSIAIRAVIAGRKFQELDRRLRQELVAIDGATVIDHEGHILTVGAILQIPGGSSGGGRLAAAKELSKLGLGIKISQDGGIRCFQDGKDQPKILLM